MKAHFQIGLMVLLSVLFFANGTTAQTKIDTDFSSNPTFNGWNTIAGHQFQEKNTWTAPDDDTGYITVRKGRWRTPNFQVKPFHYYRLTVKTRFEIDEVEDRDKSDLKGGYWAAFFYDNQVNVHPANHYSLIYPSTEWKKHTFVFMAEQGTVGAHLLFSQKSNVPLSIASVRVEAISKEKALSWSETLYEELPELNYQPPEERHEHLDSVTRKLENGEDVKIVSVGNSIANDITNGSVALLLERAYPESSVNWVTSVGGGKGAWYFRRHDRVQKKITEHNPDLVILGGVSHWGQIQPFRDVIEQIRDEIDVDILVLTGVITPPEGMVDWIKKIPYLNKSEARDVYNTFPGRLKKMAKEKDVEFMHLRKAWEHYIDSADRPRKWFMRDAIHGNTRGKQIAGRLLIRYLSPNE